MVDIPTAIKRLNYYVVEENEFRKKLGELIYQDIPDDERDRRQRDFTTAATLAKNSQEKVLNELLVFPPQLQKHFQKLPMFFEKGAYDKSVFIMTKFPEGNNDEDNKLSAVIQSVQNAVTAQGLIPRLASDYAFQESIWENVELYLCGCRFGVAIVENKYKNELNPNVTMEWGWMRAMGKKVLYLVEADFDRTRADIIGLIRESFSWSDPATGITSAMVRHFPV